MSPSSPALYSRSWANEVVANLYKKHARATDIVLEILDLTPANLATYLIRHDPLFAKLRDLIHKIEILDQNRVEKYKISDYSSFLSKYYQHYLDKRIVQRLTAVHGESMLVEQVMKGGNRRLPAECSLPSSLPSGKVVDDGYGPQILLGFS